MSQSYFSPRFVLLLFVLVQSAAAHGADLKAKVAELGLKPHKALYDIKLASTHSGSQILNISGQMFYEWQQTCDAAISNHRFNMLYEYADSAPMRIASDFSTYEPFDGQSFVFTSQRKRDSELFEELRGKAAINADTTGKAVFSLPPDLAFDLPAGTLFPLEHTIAVAENIRAGKKFFNATIFDGSDETGPVEVNAFVGNPLDAAKIHTVEAGPAIDAALIASPARSVRLAFFPLDDPESTSDYEMTMNLHDNGVISDMTIEYEDFTVSQTLKALEPTADACASNNFNP